MSTSQVESLLDGAGGCTGHAGAGRRALAHNINSNFNKKHGKHDSSAANHSHKYSRKRTQNQLSGSGSGKFHPPHKKRRSRTSILPTKFLLGGNICDPLNLGSLQDEDINRAMNAVTPKSSPLPTPKHRKGEIEVIIPPNINDPLNLNSCENDEEYVAQLAKTSPVKRPRGKSKRKRKRINSTCVQKEEMVEGSACTEPAAVVETPSTTSVLAVNDAPSAATSIPAETTASRLSLDLNLKLEIPSQDATTPNLESPTKKAAWLRRSEDAKDRRLRKMDLKDKIVSPVIWQPGTKPLHPRIRHKTGKNETKQQIQPKFNPKNASFQYGNYNRYYGYRNVLHAPDVRLKCFSNFPDLFKDKDVLDIGCNIGHITLSVGRDFRARSVIGIDIDRGLIEIARKNVQHYVNYQETPSTRGTPNTASEESQPEDKRPQPQSGAQTNERFFPISMPIVYGPVDIPGITDGMAAKAPSAPKPFPQNVSFVQGNYVLQSDALLDLEKPQFDVILCLSMTKWIHLNWGDDGLKRAFRRMFAQLRPGGKLILESQGWTSYKKKKNLTEAIWNTFKSISFFPHQFRAYLLSEVGFTKSQVLDVPQHSSKGFCRPITMFFKPSDRDNSSQSVPSAVACSVQVVDTPEKPVRSDSLESPESPDCSAQVVDIPEKPVRTHCLESPESPDCSAQVVDIPENPVRSDCLESPKSPDCVGTSETKAKDSNEGREVGEESRIGVLAVDEKECDFVKDEDGGSLSPDESVGLHKVQCATKVEPHRTQEEPLPPRLDKTEPIAVFSEHDA